MKIFISWSGDKSRHIAEALSNWIEQVLQATEPWISTEIDKGKRWSDEIASKLEESSVAIICLTEDNLDSKWIHFEAGAIAKNKSAYVCTFLYDLKPTSVQQPLSQFQNTRFVKNDVLKLCNTINDRLKEEGFKSIKESNLKSVFNTFWPILESELKSIPVSKSVVRTDRDLLEESLQILRTIKSIQPAADLTSSDDDIDTIKRLVYRFAMNEGLSRPTVINEEYIDQIVDYIYGCGHPLSRHKKTTLRLMVEETLSWMRSKNREK